MPNETEFMHYGMKQDANHKGSGRYPKGSGKRPYQHDSSARAQWQKERKASSGSSREDYARRYKQENSQSYNGHQAPSFERTPDDGARDGNNRSYHSDSYTSRFLGNPNKVYSKDKPFTPMTKEEYLNHQANKEKEKQEAEAKAKEEAKAKAEAEAKAKAEAEAKKPKKKKNIFDKAADAINEDTHFRKKTKSELMEMSQQELEEYARKLNKVREIENLQSPTKKFLKEQGGALAQNIAKEVAIPAMTRFIKRGLYNSIKASDKKIDETAAKWLAGYYPEDKGRDGKDKKGGSQGGGGGNQQQGDKGGTQQPGSQGDQKKDKNKNKGKG